MFGLLGYLVAGAGSLWSSEHKSGRVMVSVAGGAVLLHLSGLVLWSLRVGHLPLTGSADTFASLALLVGVGGLYARRLPRMALLEGLLTPMAAVLLALGLILPVGDVLREPEGAWLVVHIAGMVMGVAGFALSFGASVAWFQVRRRLKSKRLEGLGRLPSMDQLDRLNTRFTLFGFAALTVGISGGGVWAHFDGFPDLDPTIITTRLLWGWYALAIQLRVVSGWRGRLAAMFSIVGFGIMLSCYLVIQVTYQGWHA